MPWMTRRTFFSSLPAAVSGAVIAGCAKSGGWTGTDVWGHLPPLRFAMNRANDGKLVTASDYHGKVVLLYFGYTSCPDICPVTLANLSTVIRMQGSRADRAAALFVTVDPERDTLDVLKKYVSSFGPQTVGLRGTADQLAALARRYRVAYSVRAGEVVHSEIVYVFDAAGVARLLFEQVSSASADLAGFARDIDRIIG